MITKKRIEAASALVDEMLGERYVNANFCLVSQLMEVQRLLTIESEFAPGDWVVRKRDMGSMKPALVTHVDFDPICEQFKVWYTATEKGNTKSAYQYELELCKTPERKGATIQ